MFYPWNWQNLNKIQERALRKITTDKSNTSDYMLQVNNIYYVKVAYLIIFFWKWRNSFDPS